MRFKTLHRWDLTTRAARELQQSLRERVRIEPLDGDWSRLAAADVSFERRNPLLHAVVVVIERETGHVIEQQGVSMDVRFPYVPGLLSFREAPVLLAAFRKLRTVPDLVLCDGQGQAHPRRMGLASHLGLWLDLPTIGCAKSRLCGTFEPPGRERGSFSDLSDQGERVGRVLRTRTGVQPLFLSVGHRCTLADAQAVVLERAIRTRLPEPSRQAHRLVNQRRLAAKSAAGSLIAAKGRADSAS